VYGYTKKDIELMTNKNRKILIVDDDERNIFALKAVLTARNFDCVTAAGGSQALQVLDTTPGVEAVLLDMMMPGIDGYELAAALKKDPHHGNLMVVAVTAQAMPGDKEKCLSAGADAYISKPGDIDQLMDILNKAHRRHD
jgi:two-component system, cell cycle response regulator DivK